MSTVPEVPVVVSQIKLSPETVGLLKDVVERPVVVLLVVMPPLMSCVPVVLKSAP
jgi:hypothetical protein